LAESARPLVVAELTVTPSLLVVDAAELIWALSVVAKSATVVGSDELFPDFESDADLAASAALSVVAPAMALAADVELSAVAPLVADPVAAFEFATAAAMAAALFAAAAAAASAVLPGWVV